MQVRLDRRVRRIQRRDQCSPRTAGTVTRGSVAAVATLARVAASGLGEVGLRFGEGGTSCSLLDLVHMGRPYMSLCALIRSRPGTVEVRVGGTRTGRKASRDERSASLLGRLGWPVRSVRRERPSSAPPRTPRPVPGRVLVPKVATRARQTRRVRRRVRPRRRHRARAAQSRPGRPSKLKSARRVAVASIGSCVRLRDRIRHEPARVRRFKSVLV